MTITRFENGHTGGQAETLRKLQASFEKAGCTFSFANNGRNVGVFVPTKPNGLGEEND